VQERLLDRSWTQGDLADVLGRPVQAVNEIITGKKAITPETAVALSKALGNTANFWLNLESAYRLDLLHHSGSGRIVDVERRARLLEKVPLKELKRLGWIDVDLKNVAEAEKAVCRFLGTTSMDEEPNVPFAARKAEKYAAHSAAQRAWICRVRDLAARQHVAKYSSVRLARAVAELPKLSTTDDTTRTVPSRLAGLGIRFVVATHLTGTKIDGGTVWLDESAPVVAVSFRYDRMDWFWFTLMHEIAHVLAGDGKDGMMLDQALVGRDADPSTVSDVEKRADQAASMWLIPTDRMNEFIRRTSPYYSRTAILQFAASLEVHPAIVAGQLQNRKEIPYTHHRNLLTNVRHLFTGEMLSASRKGVAIETALRASQLRKSR
jgi:HTH-type transcriptional regulator/antitoxin HigA